MPSSAWAQTVATSATLPLVIHILLPVKIQSSPSRTARVRMPAGFDPKSGSVSPKQPIASPAASRGSHCCFCCSEPYFQIDGELARRHAPFVPVGDVGFHLVLNK